MTWMLIVLGVAVVISPLMWFRQSPRQKLITELRRSAGSAGLQVSLYRRPDARDEETRLECVCYRMPWLHEDCRQNWVLHRFSSRGWDSNCPGWLWTINQAAPEWDPLLAEKIEDFPAGVSALVATAAGIGVIWNERDGDADLVKIVDNLKKFQHQAKEICR